MRKFFLDNGNTLICHNAIRYDKAVVERILGIKVQAKIIDTLPISWYLEFDRQKHGLESWGETFGIPKPQIDDWENLTYEDYRHRCEEDVKINWMLWGRLWGKLLTLYESEDEAIRLINYLNFKMECAAQQEKDRWKLDVAKAEDGLEKLMKEKEEKTVKLASVMPEVPVIAKRERPKKPFKKDGTHSTIGAKWFTLLKERGMEESYEGVVEVVTGHKPPNPGSVPQIKDWLFSLGWKPETYKFVRNKETGEIKQIPQVNSDVDEGVCNSVKKLYGKEPMLELLNGLSVLTNRISTLKGFLDNTSSDGYIQAKVQGLTNTFRFKHAVCVNLPGVDKPHGALIRGCLIAPEGYELCGSDMCSLEETTKHHYMWKFDKPYVREMMKEGFDAHLDLALHAGAITVEQVEAHKRGLEDFSAIRKQYKTVNYG
jgi:hypothetical protein